MNHFKKSHLANRKNIVQQTLSIFFGFVVFLSFSIINYTSINAQSFPVTISADGPTTFCSPATVTLSAPLTQTGTTSQLAPGSGTAADCNCPAGYVVVGIQGRTGFWLDQFTLICQQMTTTGTLTGATVLTTPNGASTGGSAAGAYMLPAGNVMVGASSDYYHYGTGQDYLESIGLKGQTPAFIVGNGNNSSSPTTATTIEGNQTPTASLGTQYAPSGSVITGMKSFDKTYSAGVQWIYTPISQIMTSYVWSPGGQTTRSITVSSSNTYTLTASGGYGTGSDSKVVTVSSTPVIPASFAVSDADVCRGDNNVAYSITPVSGATSYAWNFTGAGETISNGTTNSVTVNFSNSATSGNMVVNASNSCGTSSNLSMAVTVSTGIPANPPGTTITGSAAICGVVSGQAYSVTAATGSPAATSYTWTYTTGTGATINGSTNNITVDYSSGATSGVLNVVSTNGCGSNSTVRTKSITVSTGMPAAPTAFSIFDAAACQGETGISYVVTPVAGATSYIWSYSGNGETITGTTNSVSVDFSNSATSGNMRVAATNSCGTSANLSGAVTMNSVPGRPGNGVSGISPVCQGQTGSYSVPASSGATSYTWSYNGGGATINGTTNNITIDFDYTAASGTLTVYGTNACGNSSQSRTGNITIRTAPAMPSVITPSNASPCNTSTGTTYGVTNVGGLSYAWSYVGGTGSTITSGTTGNSITVSYAGATNGTWTVTPSNANCAGPSRTYNTNLQVLGAWSGTTSTAWNVTANWGCGSIPTSTTDVTFSSGVTNMPTVPASYTASARNLTIGNLATLTNAVGGTLNVYGNFTNGGNFTDNNIYSSAGKVNFTGSTGQSITGTTTFSNLTIANSAGVGIPAGNATTVNGILTLSSGVFATNGNLNQNLYNGAIAPGGGGTVTGSINFFKTIWGDKYHYISLPVPTSGITTAQWTDDVLIKSGANSNLYSYNEALPDSNQKVGWTAIAPGATLNAMTGYALYFPRWSYNTTLDVSTSYDNTITSVSSGTLKNTPSTTPVAKLTSDGWNLLGNPFPSTLDWTLVAAADRSGLNNAVYSYDSRRMLFTAYVAPISINGGTQYIGSMQGFFVKVVTSGGTGSLTLRNTARVTSTLKDVWRTQGSSDKRLRLTVANGSYADELVVRFNDEATEQFDSEYDGYKLINDEAVPSVFTYTAEANYCVNSLPSTLTEKTIALQLNVASDTLCTWTADLSGFTNEENIVLEDRLLGTSQSLTEHPTYAILLKKGVYANRFFLQYNNRQAQVTETKGTSADAGIDIASVQQNVVLLFTNQSPGDANIAVFDALGKKVYEAQNASTASGRIDINLQDINNGIYIVKVQTPSAIRSQQVYLIK